MDAFEAVEAINEVTYHGKAAIANAERTLAWGRAACKLGADLREAAGKDPSILIANGEKARQFLEDRDTAPVIEVCEEQPAKRERKQRADAGKPRGPKGGAREGRTSPLTDERRDMLNLALKMGPTTRSALAIDIANMSKSGQEPSETDVENWLCEDPAAYVRWMMFRAGDSNRVEVWGTAAQFDAQVGVLALQCPKVERDRFTSAALGCSVGAAHDAWNRLDPTSTKEVFT